jgi:flagellar assembly protein FliH
MASVSEKNRPEKFLFNLNVFDEDFVEEPEEEIPPPPTYSEEELEAAKKEAYESGRQSAFDECKKSREEYIAARLAAIAARLPELFESEKSREEAYQQEAVMLTCLALRKLFPALNARHGFDEIAAVIQETLQGLHSDSGVVAEVCHDDADALRALLESPGSPLPAGSVEILGTDDLPPGDCRLRWKSGGALRSAGKAASEIEAKLLALLPDGGSGVPPEDNGIDDDRGTMAGDPEPPLPAGETDDASNNGENP